MYKKILLVLENNTADQAPISHAINLAHEQGATVTLLHVLWLASGEEGMMHLLMEPGSKGWSHKLAAEEELRAIERQFQENGVTVDEKLVVADRPEAEEIVDLAEKGQFDLIVMEADNRSWWQRARLGSVSDEVEHRAGIPTLFVGAPAHHHAAAQQELGKDPLRGFGQLEV